MTCWIPRSKTWEEWQRTAEKYKSFVKDCPLADFSEAAARAVFLNETTGAAIPNMYKPVNGYALEWAVRVYDARG